jgi:cobalt/nickel transport system ATP-binding protein
MFEVRAAEFRYRDVTAIAGLSLDVRDGQRIAVLGANGSGKSTLLRMLAGLCFPDSGTVTFRGKELTEDAFGDDSFAFDFRRRVGVVFQNPEIQLFNPTVFDELAFGPLQLRWPRERILDEVNATLERFEIAHLRDRAPHHLSGGEKKRVALASVLVVDPEVLLLDEPTDALDPASQSRMTDFLSRCAGEKTVITTTHDLDIVPEIADHCFVLKEGRLASQGSPGEILANEQLLLDTHLLHSHRHRHASGLVHSHPHLHHGHGHEHGHG